MNDNDLAMSLTIVFHGLGNDSGGGDGGGVDENSLKIT